MSQGKRKEAKKVLEKSERVPVRKAAEMIGCRPSEIHYRMLQGEWDLGVVVKAVPPAQRNRYLIFRDKLYRFVGKEITCSD